MFRRTLRMLITAGLLGAAISLAAQDAAEFFEKNCISCHTIGGGRLTGPDLKDVAARADREWLVKFILDAPGAVASGDPRANQLLRESKNVQMPAVAGITRPLAEKLLDLIAAESKLPKSKYVGSAISDRPLTAADVAAGRAWFSGAKALTKRGPACISCHSAAGLKGLGGGTLGPDLTTAFGRLQGRKGLAAWLSAPATPTMQALFKSRPMDAEEVLGLTAYLEDVQKTGAQSADVAANRMGFLVAGVVAALVFLLIMDLAWKGRFRAVREPLVRGEA